MSKGRNITLEQVMQMQELRAQGLTNAQIGIEMGLTAVSVRRHIGAQPTGMKAAYGSMVSHATGESFNPMPIRVMEKKPTKLSVVSSTTLLQGEELKYEVDNRTGYVTIQHSPMLEYPMDKDTLERLILELMDVYEYMQKTEPKSQEKPSL